MIRDHDHAKREREGGAWNSSVGGRMGNKYYENGYSRIKVQFPLHCKQIVLQEFNEEF